MRTHGHFSIVAFFLIVYYAVDSSLATHTKSTCHGTEHIMSHGGDVMCKFHSDLAISTMQWTEDRAGFAASHSLLEGA